MANAKRTVGVVVGCVILGSAVGALAQDWPQWRGPNRDGKAAGRRIFVKDRDAVTMFAVE